MESSAGDRLIRYLFSAIAVCIAGLTIIAALYPSASNWGLNAAAFLPGPWKIIIPVLMLAMVFPSVQLFLVRIISVIHTSYSSRPRQGRILFGIIGLGFLGIVFWMGRERLYFLGDGNLILRILERSDRFESIATVFKNEPLAGYLLGTAYRIILSAGISTDPAVAVQVVSIVSGLASTVVFWKFTKSVAGESPDRIFIFLLLFTAGGLPLFFGYVEVYTPFVFGLVTFIWLTHEYLGGRVRLFYPMVAYGILFTLHFGALIFFPIILYCIFHNISTGVHRDVPLSIVMLLGIVYFVLWVCSYTPDQLFQILMQGGSHFLLKSNAEVRATEYVLLSFAHLINIFNSILHISPFLFIGVGILGFRSMKKRFPVHTENVFLITGMFSVVFILSFNSEIGLSRDWDIIAAFSYGLILPGAVSLATLHDNAVLQRQLLVMMAGVVFLQTAAFIGVNTSEEASLIRCKTLPDRQLWPLSAHLSFNEELAIYYRGERKPDQAIKYLTDYITLDSSNARIYVSLAHIYKLMGDRSNAIRWLEAAARLNIQDDKFYLELGIAKIMSDSNRAAIPYLEKALALNPNSAVANTTMGNALLNSCIDDGQALYYFCRAIAIDSSDIDALRGAGICSYKLGDRASAQLYLARYFRMKPDAPVTADIEKILKSSK